MVSVLQPPCRSDAALARGSAPHLQRSSAALQLCSCITWCSAAADRAGAWVGMACSMQQQTFISTSLTGIAITGARRKLKD